MVGYNNKHEKHQGQDPEVLLGEALLPHIRWIFKKKAI